MDNFFRDYGHRKIAYVIKNYEIIGYGIKFTEGSTVEVRMSSADPDVPMIFAKEERKWLIKRQGEPLVKVFLSNGNYCFVPKCILWFDLKMYQEKIRHFERLLQWYSKQSIGRRPTMIGRICVTTLDSLHIQLFYQALENKLKEKNANILETCTVALKECCRYSTEIAKRFPKYADNLMKAVLSALRMDVQENEKKELIKFGKVLVALGLEHCKKEEAQKFTEFEEKMKKHPNNTTTKQQTMASGRKATATTTTTRRTATTAAGRYVSKMPRFEWDSLEIIKQLGSGGQAVAILAKTQTLPDSVVAKIFLDEEKDEIDVESCLREIDSLMQFVIHPNIVRIFGSVYDEKTPVGILMEFCDGGSLFDAIHDEDYKYNTSRIIRWSMQAASALQFLHDKKVLHRDVKPANMLLCNRRRDLKVSDLGMTKKFPKLPDAGQSKKFKSYLREEWCGTSGYIAPEMQEMKAYNEKADVYGLGVSIWEMVARSVPSSGQALKGKSAHAWMNSLVEQMIQRNPSSRPSMKIVYQKLNSEQLNIK